MTATPDRDRALLAERAARLAASLAQPPTGQLELVSFELAGERYGIEAAQVFEVFRLTHLTPLPGAAPPVRGLTTWHGSLLAIFDLRPALGLPTRALDDLGQVVVLGAREPQFGVLVDRVHGIVSGPRSDLQPPPEGLKARGALVAGITTTAVVVLATDQLLAIDA